MIVFFQFFFFFLFSLISVSCEFDLNFSKITLLQRKDKNCINWFIKLHFELIANVKLSVEVSWNRPRVLQYRSEKICKKLWKRACTHWHEYIPILHTCICTHIHVNKYTIYAERERERAREKKREGEKKRDRWIGGRICFKITIHKFLKLTSTHEVQSFSCM